MPDPKDGVRDTLALARMMSVYASLVNDLVAVVEKTVDEIASRTNDDEPTSPTDQALLELTSEILEAISKNKEKAMEAASGHRK
ncbi:hypothetical protein [Cupriavidus basilensis]